VGGRARKIYKYRNCFCLSLHVDFSIQQRRVASGSSSVAPDTIIGRLAGSGLSNGAAVGAKTGAVAIGIGFNVHYGLLDRAALRRLNFTKAKP
jgi:hypothetical protein